VNQTHFNLLPDGKMRPAAIPHHLESRETIVDDTIFSSESLKELKLHIPHSRPQFAIELGYRLLSRKRAIEAIESACFEDNVICVQLESRLDVILCFAMKMAINTCQVLDYSILVHGCLLSEFRLLTAES